MTKVKSEAEFFAQLANIEDPEGLSEEEKPALLRGLEQAMPAVVALVRSWSLVKEQGLGFARSESITAATAEEQQHSLWLLLKVTHAQVRRCLVGLLAGETVELPFAAQPIGWVWNRQLMEESKPKDEAEQVFAIFLQVLRQKPFPFGRCEVCHKVFSQAAKGQPRRYCSVQCKWKGIPSAATKATYVQLWRRQRQEQEVKKVAEILLHVSLAHLWEALHQEFPRKSRRELLSLMKRAEKQVMEEIFPREEGQK